MKTKILLTASLVGLSAYAQEISPANLDVTIGKPISWKAAKYPKNALKNKTQGSVVLRLTVGKDGRVNHVEVVSGEPEFADAAARAATKWLYVPYFRDAKPTEIQTLVSINFKLDERGEPEITAAFKDAPPPPLVTIFKVGNGVDPPRAIYTRDPEYSEQARSDKYQGTCVLQLIVGPDGRPYDIKVSRPLGYGLDVKAVEAVQQWRFKPAMKDGQAVAVAINVEVQFRLY